MKIGSIPIISFGLLVSVSMLSWAFFHNYQPNVTEMEGYKKYRDALKAEYAKKDQVTRRVQNAEQFVLAKAAEWRAIAQARTPLPSVQQGGIDLTVNGFKLPADAAAFRNSMQKAINRQLRSGGVRVVSGPNVPLAPTDPQAILSSYFNYPAVNYPVVIHDLGPVTVEGTFAQISANMRSWSTMPHYLAVADRLRLDGTSPRLTGTYDLTVVGFIRRTGPLFPPIPQSGAALVGAPADNQNAKTNQAQNASAPVPTRGQG